MRRLVGSLAAVLLMTAACTGGSDTTAEPKPTMSSSAPAIKLASLDVEWPRVDDTLDVAEPPAAPAGFDADLVSRMAGILHDWADATTVDDDVWHSTTPVEEVVAKLPAEVGSSLSQQTADAVSPELAVANVFADEVTVVGAPIVTTAWKISTEVDQAGQQYVLLQLQTRAAYEVRVGDAGPTRVIGMLRVHGLSAYPDTTTDYGVSSGWQEFGAGDCSLALDDDLVPETDLEDTARDLKTFVEVGNGSSVLMPTLDDEDQVDAEYLQRCRNGTT